MLRKTIIASLFVSFTFSLAHSQTINDAVRFSSYDYASTARSIGVGGAFSALGADISAVNINPAGLGEYRFGELVFSLGFNFDNQDASLAGQTPTGNRTANSNLGVLGYVSTNRHRSSSALDYSSFSISLNRFLNFDNAFEYQGTTAGSITERFTEQANTFAPNDLDLFEGGPAFDAGAIFDFDGDLFYETDFGDFSTPVERSQTVTRGGSGNELSLGYGASLKKGLSFGVNLGIPIFSFEETRSYTETDSSNSIDFFEELQYDEVLETSGVGVNAKLGVIYKLKKFRLSLAGHTPSLLFLTDEFFTDLFYTFNDTGASQTVEINSPLGEFDYRLRTPWRAILGGAYLFTLGPTVVQQKNEENAAFAERRRRQVRGFLTAEVEYVGFSNSNFNLTANSSNPLDAAFEETLNTEISTELRSIPIVKVGAEIAKGKFRYRAGVRYQPSIFENDNDSNIRLNGGLGVRLNRVFIDLAATFETNSSTFSPYFLLDDSNNQIVDVDGRIIRLDVTLGYKL